MKLYELIQGLDAICPFSLQEDFDNSGLQVGDEKKEVQRIFLAFDFTEAVLEEALAKKADVIITHHPFLFYGIKTIDRQSWQGKMIFRLIQENVALVALHTNLDKIDFGVNIQLGKDLGLQDLKVLFPEESGMGLGAIGKVAAPLPFADFVTGVKENLRRPSLKFAGNPWEQIETVAVLGGAGAEFIEAAKEKGADVYVSSDFKYHDAQKARNIGINIIDAGHFGTEVGVVRALAERLKKEFPKIEVITCSCMSDYWEYK